MLVVVTSLYRKPLAVLREVHGLALLQGALTMWSRREN
jgi:hypothetical protein